MPPIRSVTLKPNKPLPRRDSEKTEIIEDDRLSIRSIVTEDSRDEAFSPRSGEMPRRAVSPPPRMEGIQEGMRCEVANQSRDRRGFQGYSTEVKLEDNDDGLPYVLHPDEEWLKQFAIIARKQRKPNMPVPQQFESIRIRSPLLKPILRGLCKEYPGFHGHKLDSLFAMDLYDPFDALFHCWGDLLRLEEDHADPDTRDHLKLLRDLIEPCFKKALRKVEECRLNGNITFNFLWTIFKPGDLIYRKDAQGRECVERIEDMYYGTNNGRRAFKVESKMLAWDGKRFGYGISCGSFYDCAGTMRVMDLAGIPLELHPDKVGIKARAMKRGEKFQKLAGCHLKAYTGPITEAVDGYQKPDKSLNQKLEAHDRILINPNDVGCPHIAINLDPLVKEDPFESFSGGLADRASSPGSLRRSIDRRAATDLRKAREEWDSKTKMTTPSSHSKRQEPPALTEDQLMLCVPDVACFDILRKEWLILDLNEIDDVSWNEDSFDDLIWPEEEKDLLLAITQSYTNHPLDKNASGGITIMLTGPSGTGKAFAVAAIAEKLHMPLYALSIGELIRDFGKFEQHLEDILDRCAKWNAILLIKNIDFFFDKTLSGIDGGDVHATLMHHLDQHKGLVFLTASSSDLAALDPLLKARFDLILDVQRPDSEIRRTLWANALSAAVPLRDQHFRAEDLDGLAEIEVCGREIQSVVKMAGMLARSKGGRLGMKEVEAVLRVKKVGAGEEKREEKEGLKRKGKGKAVAE